MKDKDFDNFIEIKKSVRDDSKYYHSKYKDLTPTEHFLYQEKLKERIKYINNFTKKG